MENKIKISLSETYLWRKFNSVTNEMIVTKSGRRMFPVLSVSINGLDPKAMYSIMVDFEPISETRWKYLNGEWVPSGKQESITKSSSYVHPDSPNFGDHWMKNIVTFTKIKLTNKASSDGQIMLQSLHKYRPRIHVVKVGSSEKQKRLANESFPETEFIAVTAYQNEEITQLKIKHNPFAKAFLDNKERGDEIYQENPPLPYPHMSGWIFSTPTPICSRPTTAPFQPAVRLSHQTCETLNGLRSHRASPYSRPKYRQHTTPGYTESPPHSINFTSDWSSISPSVTASPCAQYPIWQSIGSRPTISTVNDIVSSSLRRTPPIISSTTFPTMTLNTRSSISPITHCSSHQDGYSEVRGFLPGQLSYCKQSTAVHPNYSHFNYGGLNI